jgi:hypothetical protein
MRRHEQESAWRRVLDGNWKHDLQLKNINIVDLSGFTCGITKLNAGLTIFCGVNATGKSRLLRSIAASLKGAEGDPLVTTVGLEGRAGEVHFVDIFHLSQVQLGSIDRDSDLASRVEQAGESPLRPKELRMLSWLVGRDYEGASIAELDATVDESDALTQKAEGDSSTVDESIDLAVADENIVSDIVGTSDRLGRSLADFRPEVVPYFTLTYNGRKFGSESISRGELAAMNLLWVLKSTDAGSGL